MQNFGPSLDRHRVQFILISGQATVLYGAATFSEDVDLWVEPSADNLQRLLKTLAALHARVYKLTPPVTAAYARKGHGFHFTLPSSSGPVYLDIMGRPPRVGSFDAALKRAHRMKTPWGTLPVLAIPALVEIKKTRRLGDYDVISRLVRIRLEAAGNKASPSLLRWALSNSFTAEDLEWMLERFPAARRIASRLRRPAVSSLLARAGTPEEHLNRCRRRAAEDVARLQHLDTVYWNPILSEIRRLWREKNLLVEGTPVRELLA